MPADYHINLVETGFMDELDQPVSTVDSEPIKSVSGTATTSSAVVAGIVAPASAPRTKILWLVTAGDVALDVAFATTTPNAAGDKTHRVPAGSTRDFRAREGQVPAVKAVS